MQETKKVNFLEESLAEDVENCHPYCTKYSVHLSSAFIANKYATHVKVPIMLLNMTELLITATTPFVSNTAKKFASVHNSLNTA